MVVVVIGIAVWMAGLLTRRITAMIDGIHAFQQGDLSRRLDARSADEMGELASSFNRMADSVEESFKRLDEARKEAEEASRQKSAFLATMSHELRTPLNGILGFAELLKLELADPTHQEYAGIIQQSGEHLLNLVNEILDLAKIESGEMTSSHSNTDCRAGHRMRGRASGGRREQGLALCPAPGRRPAGTVFHRSHAPAPDPEQPAEQCRQIHRAGRNFTGRQPDGDVAFAVRDTGIGIPPESLDTIFEKFKQLENFLTREHGGTGLGLALVKQLVDHMGGRITLDSEVGVGSTFTVFLPLDGRCPRPTPGPGRRRPAHQSPAGLHLLKLGMDRPRSRKRRSGAGPLRRTRLPARPARHQHARPVRRGNLHPPRPTGNRPPSLPTRRTPSRRPTACSAAVRRRAGQANQPATTGKHGCRTVGQHRRDFTYSDRLPAGGV
jgi:HAMP domain-containing protein